MAAGVASAWDVEPATGYQADAADEVLQGAERVRFRLVCQADDAKGAERAAALVRECILTGEHQ